MAVKIRLKRLGKKKYPCYRIVAATDHAPRDGKDLEVLGQYNPNQDPVFLNVNEEQVKYWLSVGAQPTDTVKRLLAALGLTKKPDTKSQNQGIKRKDLKKESAE